MNFEIKREPEEQMPIPCDPRWIPACQQPESSKKQQLKKKDKIKKSKKLHYNWSQTENRKYLKFLIAKKHVLCLSVMEKKMLKVNIMMSKRVETRTATQCHTHHQKVMMKYGTIDNAIEAMTRLYNTPPQSSKVGRVQKKDHPLLFNSPNKTKINEIKSELIKEEQNSTKSQTLVKMEVMVEEGQLDYKYYN